MKKTINIILLLTCLYAVDYQTEIQPIFNADCTNCHGYPNQYGNLVLFSYDDLINSGAVVPGDASSSSLYDRITRDESENGDMPPTGGNMPPMDGDMPPMPDGMDDMASHMDQAAADTAPAYDPGDAAAAPTDTGDMPDMPPPPESGDDIV